MGRNKLQDPSGAFVNYVYSARAGRPAFLSSSPPERKKLQDPDSTFVTYVYYARVERPAFFSSSPTVLLRRNKLQDPSSTFMTGLNPWQMPMMMNLNGTYAPIYIRRMTRSMTLSSKSRLPYLSSSFHYHRVNTSSWTRRHLSPLSPWMKIYSVRMVHFAQLDGPRTTHMTSSTLFL